MFMAVRRWSEMGGERMNVELAFFSIISATSPRARAELEQTRARNIHDQLDSIDQFYLVLF